MQAGYNYQFGAAVAGVEIDYSWSHIRGEGTSNFLFFPEVIPDPASRIVSGQKLDSFGTIRGRLGWLPSQHWLVYATGGVAFGHRNQNVAVYLPALSVGADDGSNFTCTAGLPCFLGSAKQSTIGWTVGAGSEWAISTNVTVKAEYLYARLPGTSLTAVAIDGGIANLPSTFRTNYGHIELQVARIGINYLFNAAPVVARY